jgi:hypothetical protein
MNIIIIVEKVHQISYNKCISISNYDDIYSKIKNDIKEKII